MLNAYLCELEKIQSKRALMTESARKISFKMSVSRFTKLETVLYQWIDTMHRATFAVTSSLAISKVKRIAASINIA